MQFVAALGRVFAPHIHHFVLGLQTPPAPNTSRHEKPYKHTGELLILPSVYSGQSEYSSAPDSDSCTLINGRYTGADL